MEDLHLHPHYHIDHHEITLIFEMLDMDGDGKVSKEELVHAFMGLNGPILWFE